jgi:hypothetical protein
MLKSFLLIILQIKNLKIIQSAYILQVGLVCARLTNKINKIMAAIGSRKKSNVFK